MNGWYDLISIDPGIHTGIACWYNGRLLYAGTLFPPTAFYKECVIEIPKIYPKAQQKGDQQDLITLAFQAGKLAQATGAPTVHPVLPQTWKGQLPKDVCWLRCQALLTSEELSLIPKLAPSILHNVQDAIGIGLWKLGRLKR